MRLIQVAIVLLGPLLLVPRPFDSLALAQGRQSQPGASQGSARPTLEEVLARAAAYVIAFEDRLSGVVAEEHYIQQVRAPVLASDTNLSRANPGGGFRVPGRGDQQQILRSDYLLVQLTDGGWMPFRDVFEVNGEKVRDREDRLTALFLEPTASSFEQAARIMEDSTRHNLGSVLRTINMPVLALQLLHANVSPRIAFALDKEETVDRVRTWRVDFREKARPTLVKTTRDRDLPLAGNLWIDPSSGVVLKTSLRAADRDVRADVDVTYRRDDKLEMWVPATMQESYKARGDAGDISAIATYSNYRRFQVSTDEAIRKPPGGSDSARQE